MHTDVVAPAWLAALYSVGGNSSVESPSVWFPVTAQWRKSGLTWSPRWTYGVPLPKYKMWKQNLCFRLLAPVVISADYWCWTLNPRQIFLPQCTHQVTKVAQRVPGQLYDTLCEAAVMADEASEDGGQAIAGSVQHNSGGGSPYWYLGAAAPCRATGKKHLVSVFLDSLHFLYIALHATNPLQHSKIQIQIQIQIQWHIQNIQI